MSRYPIFLDSLVMRLRAHQTYPRMPRMPCAAPLGCMDLSTIQTDLQCTVLTQHEEFLAAGKYLCRIRHLESWWCRIGFGLIIFDPPIPLTLTTLMASCSTSHFPGDVLREIVVLPCSPPSLIRVRMEVPTFAVAPDAVSLLGQPNEASSLVDHTSFTAPNFTA